MPTKQKLFLPPLLLAGLSVLVPAFYLVLESADTAYGRLGQAFYLTGAVLVAIDLARRTKRLQHKMDKLRFGTDAVIAIGAVLSAWPAGQAWPVYEWILRLAFCGVVFVRLFTLFRPLIAPNRLAQMLGLAAALLAVAGAGFYWLEPRVNTYADGLWLAFTTGATVGYGDIIPSTPASRIFAVFMVMLGYALFSVVTASIAALFVGEEDKRIEREFRADIRALRQEIAALRRELAAAEGKAGALDQDQAN